MTKLRLDPDMAALLKRIEFALEIADMSGTAFGYRCLGDPGYLTKLREGRRSRQATVDKIDAFLADLLQGR